MKVGDLGRIICVIATLASDTARPTEVAAVLNRRKGAKGKSKQSTPTSEGWIRQRWESSSGIGNAEASRGGG